MSRVLTSSLGKWVDTIFEEMFFQPNDEIAHKAFEKYVSPDLQVRINGKALTGEAWKKVIFDARAKENFSVLTMQELFAKNGDAEVGVEGTVSHISTFTSKDKETGAQKDERTSQTIITAAWKDGQRIMTELTEVIG